MFPERYAEVLTSRIDRDYTEGIKSDEVMRGVLTQQHGWPGLVPTS